MLGVGCSRARTQTIGAMVDTPSKGVEWAPLKGFGVDIRQV